MSAEWVTEQQITSCRQQAAVYRLPGPSFLQTCLGMETQLQFVKSKCKSHIIRFMSCSCALAMTRVKVTCREMDTQWCQCAFKVHSGRCKADQYPVHCTGGHASNSCVFFLYQVKTSAVNSASRRFLWFWFQPFSMHSISVISCVFLVTARRWCLWTTPRMWGSPRRALRFSRTWRKSRPPHPPTSLKTRRASLRSAGQQCIETQRYASHLISSYGAIQPFTCR